MQVKTWVAPLLFIIGLCMIAIGVWNSEAEIVLKKAAKICLECVGIG